MSDRIINSQPCLKIINNTALLTVSSIGADNLSKNLNILREGVEDKQEGSTPCVWLDIEKTTSSTQTRKIVENLANEGVEVLGICGDSEEHALLAAATDLNWVAREEMIFGTQEP